MFANNTTFNQNIGAWDTSKVTNMSYVFAIAHMFNNGEDSSIGSWNTSQVTNMNNMFYNAIVFNQNLSGWNVALTLTRPSLTRYNFDDATPLDLPENSHKLPPFV
jgi:surface protein